MAKETEGLDKDLAAGLANGESRLDQARARTVFTTHTPVPAGNDSYPSEQVAQATGRAGPGERAHACTTRAYRRAAAYTPSAIAEIQKPTGYGE